jgi:archaemetzincin
LTNHSEYKIVISPVGNVDKAVIKPIAMEIVRVFGFKTDVIPILDDVDFALNVSRNQYHSTEILSKLEMLAPPKAIRILAITDRDLFIPILTYVYGEAQLGGRACIISTHRLNDGIGSITPDAYHFRIAKEAIHELGHTFKLRHCPDHTCIMHYCRSVDDVDRKSNQLCRYCTVLLEDEKNRLNEADMSMGLQLKR